MDKKSTYTLSIYTQWFEDDGKLYLYNAQTGFFSEVPESTITILEERLWNTLSKEELDTLLKYHILDTLLKYHIIEYDGSELDYYNERSVELLSAQYDPTVLNLVIVPTTMCNFGCPYCFEPKNNPATMTDEVISDLIQFIASRERVKELNITWYGGEPLLAFERIKKIRKELQQDGLPDIKSEGLITNGYLLTKEVCEYFKSTPLTNIQVTFDGNETSHNKTRCLKGSGEPTFHKIYENLLNAAMILPNVHISARINIDKSNIKDFADMKRKIENDFSDFPNVVVYFGLIRRDTEDGCSLCRSSIKPSDLNELAAKLNHYGLKDKVLPKIQPKGCMMQSSNHYIIGPEGEIYKCWNDVTHKDRVIGHIKDNSIANRTRLMRYLLHTSGQNQECQKCNVYPICDGGCGHYRYRNLFEGGKFNLCISYKDKENLKKALLEGYVRGQNA